MGVATAALLPFRSHVSVAAAALVFVLPVVGAMVIGGAWVGLAGRRCRLCRARRDLHPALWNPRRGERPELARPPRLCRGRAGRGKRGFPPATASRRPRRAMPPTRDGSSSFPSCSWPTRPPPRCSVSSPRASGGPSSSKPWRCCCPQTTRAISRLSACDGLELEGESLERILPAPGTPASLTGSIVAGALLRQIPLAAAGRPVGLLVLRGRALDVARSGPARRPMPTTPPSPSNEPSCATRHCGPTCYKRSTPGAQLWSGPSPMTFAHRSPRSRSPSQTCESQGSCSEKQPAATSWRRSRSRPTA